MLSWMHSCRNSFWPNGSLALPAPPRDKNTKLRTQVAAKAFLFSVIPGTAFPSSFASCRMAWAVCRFDKNIPVSHSLDELKRVLGNDTARRGMLSVYDMLQHPTLNKRLVYLILEGLLETVFPKNHFHKLFADFHSRSPRVSTKTSTRSPAVTQKRWWFQPLLSPANAFLEFSVYYHARLLFLMTI